MIVVDTNILVYLYVNGPMTEQALSLLDKEPEWIVPQFWRHEFHNVLVTHVYAGKLTADQALSTWNHALKRMEKSERPVDMEHALNMAVEYKASGYDAQFLALADERDLVCVSEDKALKIKAPAGLVKNLKEMLN